MTSWDCQKPHSSMVRSFRTARALGKIWLVPQLFFAMGPQIWPDRGGMESNERNQVSDSQMVTDGYSMDLNKIGVTDGYST